MNIAPVSLYNNNRLAFSGSKIINQKTDTKTLNEAKGLKNTVEESLRRWNVDLPIHGNVSSAKGNSINMMLNQRDGVIFAHIKNRNEVDRIITISDDGTTSVTKTYVFDPKTHQLKKYNEEKN